MNKEDQTAAIVFGSLGMVLGIIAIAIRIIALASKTPEPKKIYIKDSPYQAYCDTVGSDGDHPDATKFCQGE